MTIDNEFDAIEAVMRKEFGNLIEYARSLRSAPLENKYQEKPWFDPIFNRLIDAFIPTAENYYILAVKTIRCAKQKDDTVPVKYHFGQVLLRISDHVRLLNSLANSNNATTDKLQALMRVAEGIIWGITSRFDQKRSLARPILIPLPGRQFTYIHFNYMNNLGVIGVPISLLTTPKLSLPALWHEVGGYYIASERANGRLEKQHTELRESLGGNNATIGPLWQAYLKIYENSWLQKADVQLTLNSRSCRISNSAEIRRYFLYLRDKVGVETATLPVVQTVDKDTSWQMAWLGEFFEDLFAVEALGTLASDSLSQILARVYKNEGIGDKTHPSPALRIQVVREFLKQIGQSGPAIETQHMPPHHDPEMGIQIVKIYCDTYSLELKTPYDQANLSVHEQKVAELVMRIADGSAEIENLSSEDHALIKEIREEYIDKTLNTALLNQSNNLLRSAKYNVEQDPIVQHGDCENLTREEALERLQRLEQIFFISTDEQGPGIGQGADPLNQIPPLLNP